ncbi:MAG: NACHT domain-containing protein [Egibacteraceae bacterium]
MGPDAPSVKAAIVAFQDAGGTPAGDLSTVMGYYQGLRPARMVVLGAAGSGKTVLLLEQRKTIASAEAWAGVAVPVRFSLAAWSTDEPFEEWLAAQLSQRFGLGLDLAARLVSDRLVLPLLDGLDEMDPDDADPARAEAAVRQLNAYLQGRELGAVLLAACQRRLPLGFGSFLDWGQRAGLLRVSGIAYQFRHRELQAWLTSPATAGVR